MGILAHDVRPVIPRLAGAEGIPLHPLNGGVHGTPYVSVPLRRVSYLLCPLILNRPGIVSLLYPFVCFYKVLPVAGLVAQ